MTVLKYPGFVEGQILRRDDLNGLRDYLADRDRTLARAVGFGIAGGLVGEVTTAGLRITAGLAIDQPGEVLMLPADQTLPLPPTADEVKPPFDFVDAGVQGFTVVLVRTDVSEATVPCTETGCSGHSVMHDTGVDLLVVPGRLVPYGTDFAQETLLTAVPLSRTATGGVSGSFVTLRDQVLGRIGSFLPQATRQRLATMTVAGDKNAVALAKAAFLNEVLFAALDLLRFKALVDRNVFLVTQTPGVALGWVHPAGGGWAWDCAYRHAWDPQVGIALALFGGTCGDPSLPWVQRLVSIIDTFEPPTIPDDTQPPIIVDPPFICRHHVKWIHDDCMLKKYPPLVVAPDWFDRWKIIPDWPDRGLRITKPTLAEEVYGDGVTDPVELGLIDLVSLLGSDAVTTQGLLTNVIQESGVTQAGVDILTADQARNTPGFTFDGMAGPADRVVLIKSAAGRVVGTGRVPLTQSVKDLGVQLPLTIGKADVASAQAQEAIGKFDVLKGTVDGFSNTFVTKTAFEQAALANTNFQTSILNQLNGMNVVVKDQVAVEVAQYKAEIAIQLPNLVADSFGSIAEQVQKVNGRVDTLFARPKVSGIQDVAVAENLTAVLTGLRATVAEAAPPDKQAEVERHLKEVDLNLARIDALTTAGGSVLADSPEALTNVVDSLVAGLKAAGAPASSVNAVTKRATELRKTLIAPNG
jgi:hypothetical protein